MLPIHSLLTLDKLNKKTAPDVTHHARAITNYTTHTHSSCSVAHNTV